MSAATSSMPSPTVRAPWIVNTNHVAAHLCRRCMGDRSRNWAYYGRPAAGLSAQQSHQPLPSPSGVVTVPAVQAVQVWCDLRLALGRLADARRMYPPRVSPEKGSLPCWGGVTGGAS